MGRAMNFRAAHAFRMWALPAAWLVGLIVVAAAGFEPDPYLEYVRHMSPPHPYPTTTVLWLCLFMTLHVSLLIAVLRPASFRNSWFRALLAFVVSLAFLALGAVGALHAPPPWGRYIFWVLAITIGMLALTAYSAIGSIMSKKS
jgi:hypothetical protein